MKTVRSLVVTIPALLLLAGTGAAQTEGNPVYFAPKHGTGITLAFDYGRGLNNASDKTDYFGGRVMLGLPMVTFSAGAGSVKPDGPGAESEITFGGTVAVNLLSAPLMPVAIVAQGGLGYLKLGGTGGPGTDETVVNIPIGVAFGARLPNPALAIEPWIAPRIHIVRTSSGGTSESESNFGISGGANVRLPNGLGLHAGFDYVAVTSDDPLVSSGDLSPLRIGIGVHYKISVPGLGF